MLHQIKNEYLTDDKKLESKVAAAAFEQFLVIVILWFLSSLRRLIFNSDSLLFSMSSAVDSDGTSKYGGPSSSFPKKAINVLWDA